MNKKTTTTKQLGKKNASSKRKAADTKLHPAVAGPINEAATAAGAEGSEWLFKPDRTFKFPISVSERSDGRWSFTVDFGMDANGHRNRPCSTRKTEEAAMRAAMQVYLAGPTKLQAVAPVLTVSMLLARVMERSRLTAEYSTLSNLAWLNQIIDKHIGHRLVAQLTTEDVHDVLTTLSEKDAEGEPRYAESTVCKVYQRLCRVLDVAVRDDVVLKNVAKYLDRERRPRLAPRPWVDAWSNEAVGKIIRTTLEIDPKLYPLVVMAFASGVRIGELVGARLGDYDPTDNSFRAFGTAKEGGGRGPGKTVRAHREILLPEVVRDVMEDHLNHVRQLREELGAAWGVKRECSEETREKKRQAALKQWGRDFDQSWSPDKPVPTETHEWLFPTTRGTRDFKNNIGRRWRKVLEAAEIDHRVFHTVRATVITAALEANVPLHEIQAMVGHASPVMTIHYSHRPKKSDAASRAAAHLGLDAGVKSRRA